MDSLINDICVLVTAALVLAFVPGLRLRERSLLSMRDQGSALLVFIVLGLVEEVNVLRSGPTGRRTNRGGLRCWFTGRPFGRGASASL
jgi:hypothetical protein